MGISKQFAEEDTDFNSVRTSIENNEIRMSPLHMKFSPLDGYLYWEKQVRLQGELVNALFKVQIY